MNIEQAEERYYITSKRLRDGHTKMTAAPIEAATIEAYNAVVKAYAEDPNAPILLVPNEKYRVTVPYKQ